MSYDALVFWLGIFMGFTVGRAFTPICKAISDFWKGAT